MVENISGGGRDGPFVELGALHKLLDILKPNDLECTSAWYSSSEPCCKEIVLRFRNLLNKWASDEKRVQDCLAKDYTLTKCEHCGVIKCVEWPQVQENIMERKRGSKLTTPGARPAVKCTRKQEIMKNSHPVVPRHNKSDVPTPLDKLTLRNISRNSTEPLTQVFKTNNNKAIIRSHEKNTIGTSPVIVDKYLDEEYRKFNDIGVEKYLPLMETVQYLVRGNFTTREDDGSQRFADKSTKLSYLRKLPTGKKHSFALHGSRDAHVRDDSPGFSVCDRLRLAEEEMKNRSRTVREEVSTKIDSFNTTRSIASYSQRNSGSIHVPFCGSDTSALSSSSAENLIRQWVKPVWNVHQVNLERDVRPGMRDLSSEIRATATPVIKNVQSLKAVKYDSYDQHEVDDKNINSTEPSDDLTKIQPSRHSDAVASPEIKSMKMSYDHELRGISRAMANTMGDENRISVSPVVTSKTRNKNAVSTIITEMSSRSHEDLMSETSERFEREILYDQLSSHDAICENAITMTAASKVLLIYRKILESNEEMDWESFEHLVSALHPSQRELWRDICNAVSNEAKRVAEETGATTEVCVEINPLPSKEKKRKVRCHGDEISFELDMTFKDIHIIVENNYSAVSNESKKIISKPGHE